MTRSPARSFGPSRPEAPPRRPSCPGGRASRSVPSGARWSCSAMRRRSGVVPVAGPGIAGGYDARGDGAGTERCRDPWGLRGHQRQPSAGGCVAGREPPDLPPLFAADAGPGHHRATTGVAHTQGFAYLGVSHRVVHCASQRERCPDANDSALRARVRVRRRARDGWGPAPMIPTLAAEAALLFALWVAVSLSTSFRARVAGVLRSIVVRLEKV